MQWRKTKLPMTYNGEAENYVYSTITADGTSITVLYAGVGNSYVFNNEMLCHWVLGFVRPNGRMFEPTYRQKATVLKEIGKWGEIALEVMPPEDEVVDREMVYHLWEFQYPYSFVFGIKPIYNEPTTFEGSFEGIKYHSAQVNSVRYIYFKAEEKGKEIGWRQKQNLKNHIFGKFSTAVEVITENVSDDYSCMICLPKNEYLDFGLN